MAKKPASSAFENRIHQIIAEAAQHIVVAVRHDFADEIRRLIGGVAPASAARPARGGGRKRRGRKPAAAPGAQKGRRGRRRRGGGGGGGAALDKVLGLIKTSPGLRSEQLEKQLGLPKVQVKAALAKLRENGLVKTAGQARATTYSAA